MDELSLYIKEFDLNLLKFNHEFDTNNSLFMIESRTLDLEKDMYNVITESEYDIILESKISDIGKSIGNFIEKVIKTITDLTDKCIKSIKSIFSKNEKEEMEKLIEVAKNPQTEEQKEILEEEKVEVIVNNNHEVLNNYIKELVVLERKLLNLKVDKYNVNKKINKRIIDDEKEMRKNEDQNSPSLKSIKKMKSMETQKEDILYEINKIDKKIDQLNSKYDKEFLNENKKVIEMSLKDAIRFNDKQLENVKLDFEAVEKNSKKVLKEFKKDAEGNDIPVKSINIIKKMVNCLSTRLRKVMLERTTYERHNLKWLMKKIFRWRNLFIAAGAAYGLNKISEKKFTYVPPKNTRTIRFSQKDKDDSKVII